jgi:replicative DNA helicase
MESKTVIDVPTAVEAEAAILGCCLLDGGAMADAETSVSLEDFYELRHRNLFELMLKLRNDKKPIDTISIFQEAKDTLKDGVEALGGIAYLSALPDQVPSALSLPAYVAIVKRKAKLRKMVMTAQSVLSAASSRGDDDELLEQAQAQLVGLLEEDKEGGIVPLRDVVREAINDIENAYAKKGSVIGISSGFPSLDNITTGFKGGDMIVLAARPSQGKTSLAVTIAEHVAIDQNIPTGILSLEMTSVSLIKRMLSSRSSVNGHHLMSGKISHHEIAMLTKSAAKISGAPLVIDQPSAMTVMELHATARHMKFKYGIKFLIIDYLQLMHAKADSRVHEVSKISSAVKSVAKELNIPVLVLSQLSRRVEEQDRSPRLSDLRDSGSIEQDADVVAFLHRLPQENMVQVQIQKHRNGPCGTLTLEFVPSLTKFITPKIDGMD